MFNCRVHGFSTADPVEWDKHMAELEHEYDLHIECAGFCGKKLHIKPKIKLALEAGRIPRGFVCKDCKEKIVTVPEIKEGGEMSNA